MLQHAAAATAQAVSSRASEGTRPSIYCPWGREDACLAGYITCIIACMGSVLSAAGLVDGETRVRPYAGGLLTNSIAGRGCCWVGAFCNTLNAVFYCCCVLCTASCSGLCPAAAHLLLNQRQGTVMAPWLAYKKGQGLAHMLTWAFDGEGCAVSYAGWTCPSVGRGAVLCQPWLLCAMCLPQLAVCRDCRASVLGGLCVMCGCCLAY